MKVVGLVKPGFIASHRFCKQLDSCLPAEARGVAMPFPVFHRNGAGGIALFARLWIDPEARGRILSLKARSGFR